MPLPPSKQPPHRRVGAGLLVVSLAGAAGFLAGRHLDARPGGSGTPPPRRDLLAARRGQVGAAAAALGRLLERRPPNPEAPDVAAHLAGLRTPRIHAKLERLTREARSWLASLAAAGRLEDGSHDAVDAATLRHLGATLEALRRFTVRARREAAVGFHPDPEILLQLELTDRYLRRIEGSYQGFLTELQSLLGELPRPLVPPRGAP